MASQKSGDWSKGFSATRSKMLLRRLVIVCRDYQVIGCHDVTLST